MTVRVWSLLAFSLLLAGCTDEASITLDDAALAPAPALPEGWTDTQTAADIRAAATTIGCDTETQRICFDYPFQVDETVVLEARLSWKTPSERHNLIIYRDGATVTANYAPGGLNAPTTMNVLRTLDVSGAHVLRVEPPHQSEGFQLIVTFRALAPLSTPILDPPSFGPHVVIGIPDTGINPYHELFYRPHLTEHPCTYIAGFPCDVKELRLDVGNPDWQAAFANDEETWRNLDRDAWHWIPQTAFVAVHCQPPQDELPAFGSLFGDICILDEATSAWSGHGAGTTSIAIMENPDAYLAFHEGSQIDPFIEKGIPVDVYSVSWGSIIPFLYPRAVMECPALPWAPFIVKAAGNDARYVPTDCQTAKPHIIAAGGGASSPRAHQVLSANGADFEAHWAPPFAFIDSVTDMHKHGTWGGTSFATPAIAAGISKALLEVRRASGYNGTITADGEVDPILGITAADVRAAMEDTATYSPEPRYFQESTYMVPLSPHAPWTQWGWGFYDGTVGATTAAVLLGLADVPQRPDAARTYLETLRTTREVLYG